MPPKAGARRTATNAGASGENESQQNTPGTNPAPTQSATPGPSGRPVQRLQSLKKRPASSSIAPGGRPSSTLGGEAPKPALKFKPKAVVRKSKEEREAIEKLEAERNNERLKEAAAIQRGRGGARARGATRGRGGATGVAGSGPLGSGTGFNFGGAKRGRGGGSAGGGGGYGGRRGAARGGLGGGGHFDDSSDDELRVSIDNIHLQSDEDDDDVVDIKGKKPTRRKVTTNNGLRPYRVPRREHEERTISVNMESSSSKAAEIREKAHAEATAIEVDDKSGPGPTETELLQTPVKKEPRDDEDTAMEDLPQDDDFLPATPVSVRRKTSESKNAKGKEPVEAVPQRDPRSLLRTNEEIEEYDRHLEDLEHFRNLLSIRVTEKPQKPAEAEAAESAETATEQAPEQATKEPQPEPMETETEESAADKEKEDSEPKINEHLLGQLFLMQFPPMTPTLAVPSEGAPAEPEPQPTQPAEPEVKSEDDDLQITGGLPARKEAQNVITATTPWSLPAGRVGKMNVHKSGRVTMDWGGVSFELDRAAHVDFAQEALIMSTPEAVESGQPARDTARQTAWSMGQLSGKFTVMPDWDKIL